MGSFEIYNSSAGSGKTSFLVKNYLKILLHSKDSKEFKKILVLTFTKKSSDNIKNFIIECIEDLSNKKIRKKFILDFLIKEWPFSLNELFFYFKVIKKEIFKDIYSFYKNIITIDKFNYKIIKSIFPNFYLEIDKNIFLKKIIKNILYKNDSNFLSKFLIHFSLEKLKKGKSWNVEKDIYKMISIITDEENHFFIKKVHKFPINSVIKLKSTLEKRIKLFEKKCEGIGINFFSTMKKLSINNNSFIYSDIPNLFKKFLSKDIISDPFKKRIESNMKNNIFYSSNLKDFKQKKLIKKNRKIIFFIYENAKNFYEKNILNFFLDSWILKNIILFPLTKRIKKEFFYLKKKRKIILIKESNKIFYEKINSRIFPKIYEKLGKKYKHYFIDEFQDISFMQWFNINILIKNTLSENGKVVIVGDPKQSIYRWRGGNSNHFFHLIYSNNYFNKKINILNRNFRSYKEIIRFNNSFYCFLSKIFTSPFHQEVYKNSKQKEFLTHRGYVEINIFSSNFIKKKSLYNEFICVELEKKIKEFLKIGYSLSDITILVRKNEEIKFLSENLINNEIKIISSSPIFIKDYYEIQIIVSFLYMISYPFSLKKRFSFILLILKIIKIKREKVHDFISKNINLSINKFLSKIFLNKKITLKKFYEKSVYQVSEYIINFFSLKKKNSFIIYSFLDFIYRSKIKTSESIIDFLRYWEYKKNYEILYPNSNIFSKKKNKCSFINIMTIHQSKGLQFPIVIIPFADWNLYSLNNKIENKVEWIKIDPNIYHGLDTFFIEKNSSIKNKNIQIIYDKYKSNDMFDNINLLYVATTRPVKKLVLFSKLKSEKSISNYILDFLKEKNIVWNDKKLKISFGKKNEK